MQWKDNLKRENSNLGLNITYSKTVIKFTLPFEIPYKQTESTNKL